MNSKRQDLANELERVMRTMKKYKDYKNSLCTLKDEKLLDREIRDCERKIRAIHNKFKKLKRP